MKDLSSYVKNNSKFLKIGDGETTTVIYKGYSIIQDRFNPGKETVSYLFQIPESDRTLPWTKSSNKVAVQMNKINVGETVQITRFGEGMETTYRIKVVSDAKPLSNVNPDETPF